MRDMGGRTLLHIEAESGYPWNVERQIEAGADIHARAGEGFLSFTPLHFAAEFGNADAVALLLAAGADPRIIDDEGKVPSWYASAKGMTPSRNSSKRKSRNSTSATSTASRWILHDRDGTGRYPSDD